MKANIVTIGDEILIGQIVDTNSGFIAKSLDKIGVQIHEMISISDDKQHILDTFSNLQDKVDLVIITGGLGPTKDDITKKTFCEYFDDKLVENKELNITGEESGGKSIKDSFQSQTKSFLEEGDKRNPEIKITPSELNAILRKLELLLEENKAGLGTLNLLYIATELINLKREGYLGLRLALIEELEAHLHPQAQLRVLKSLLADENSKVQYILTTHSTQLGSSVPLKCIKLCFCSNVYSLDSSSTALSESDYQFLERFLDATKANLFFAKGVIIVEGDAENILIPTLAGLLDRPLYKYGVSIVNVSSTALLRFANIFKRNDGNA